MVTYEQWNQAIISHFFEDCNPDQIVFLQTNAETLSDAYLLPSTQNRTGHLTTRRLQHIFKKYVQKAGIQEVYGYSSSGKPLYRYTIHSLRHSHIRHYVKKVPLAAVQRQAGHKSLQTTEIYLRLTDEDVKRAYEEAR